MNPYEITFIVRPDLDEEQTRATVNQVNDRIGALGGEIIATYLWNPPRRRMAYPIRDFGEGFYITSTFRFSGAALPEFERGLRLNAGVLRFLLVQATDLNIQQSEQRAQQAAARVAAPPPAAPEAAAPTGVASEEEVSLDVTAAVAEESSDATAVVEEKPSDATAAVQGESADATAVVEEKPSDATAAVQGESADATAVVEGKPSDATAVVEGKSPDATAVPDAVLEPHPETPLASEGTTPPPEAGVETTGSDDAGSAAQPEPKAKPKRVRTKVATAEAEE